jgi:hypothetical protein
MPDESGRTPGTEGITMSPGVSDGPGSLKCPYGGLLNIVYEEVCHRIDSGGKGRVPRDDANEDTGNNLSFMKQMVDDDASFDGGAGKHTKDADLLDPFFDWSYTPPVLDEVDSRRDGYMALSLADILYYTLRHGRSLYRGRGAYFKRCPCCGKLFFASRRNSLYCYFPNQEAAGKLCKVAQKGRSQREIRYVDSMKRRDAGYETVDELAHRLAARYSGRKQGRRGDMSYRDFALAWEKEQKETAHSLTRYEDRHAWLVAYDKDHPTER